VNSYQLSGRRERGEGRREKGDEETRETRRQGNRVTTEF
jgi:hypothetical protein